MARLVESVSNRLVCSRLVGLNSTNDFLSLFYFYYRRIVNNYLLRYIILATEYNMLRGKISYSSKFYGTEVPSNIGTIKIQINFSCNNSYSNHNYKILTQIIDYKK